MIAMRFKKLVPKAPLPCPGPQAYSWATSPIDIFSMGDGLRAGPGAWEGPGLSGESWGQAGVGRRGRGGTQTPSGWKIFLRTWPCRLVDMWTQDSNYWDETLLAPFVATVQAVHVFLGSGSSLSIRQLRASLRSYQNCLNTVAVSESTSSAQMLGLQEDLHHYHRTLLRLRGC